MTDKQLRDIFVNIAAMFPGRNVEAVAIAAMREAVEKGCIEFYKWLHHPDNEFYHLSEDCMTFYKYGHPLLVSYPIGFVYNKYLKSLEK